MKKLYVNGNVVAMGDYVVEERDEQPKYEIRVRYDQGYQRDERNYWNEKTKFYSNHRHYRFDGEVDDEIIDNLRKGEVDGKKYYPVYCYEHGGITLYKSRYTGPDAQWDSGMLGVAEIDNSDGNADSIFEDFYSELKAVMEGEVYEFEILDDMGEVVDCCCGFYGENIPENMYSYISSEYGISLEDVKNAFEYAEY